jgi:catechol 2,3-dioxygenase-like lactoylglutathione lyase family enzyme
MRQAMTKSAASHWTCVVNNPLRSILFAAFLALAALPGHARAAADDYVSLRVPDLVQAVGFFHDVMNCDVIARSATAGTATSAMLDCGDGSTVELTRQSSGSKLHAKPQHEPAIVFATDNAVAAAAWLRANHVVIIGQPVRTAEDLDNEKVVVEFVTPWGQPMRLVSHGRPKDFPAGTRLAAQ